MGALYESSNPKIGVWTKEENKNFERGLAFYDDKTPERWAKIAAMIPGKTEFDVINQYNVLLEDVSDIESGFFPIPGYLTSSFTLEWVDETNFDTFRKTSNMSRVLDHHDRKKGVPWTQDEHRRFLLGLQKHGKGDWRNISRNFVISKTATQVASHAQKYFLRQNSGGKDKRRPSIHDITTANVTLSSLSDTNHRNHETQSDSFLPKVLFDLANANGEALMVFNGRHNSFSSTCQEAYVGSN